MFVVIDGTDGSGKATQTKILVERLRSENFPVETISFPQYGEKSAGPVEEYLAGNYGSIEEVGPYRASILFAVDRFSASSKIKKWINEGINVVADRYVGSNMGHQGTHIKDEDERVKFYSWEMELEHGIFNIPKPDLNIILHVPAETGLELIKKRKEGNKHGQQNDLLEENIDHLKAAEQVYIDLANRFENFKLIECVENGKLLSFEEIHGRVWALLQPYLLK